MDFELQDMLERIRQTIETLTITVAAAATADAALTHTAGNLLTWKGVFAETVDDYATKLGR